MNSVVFIGDSKDNFIFKFDFVENIYTNIPYECNCIFTQNNRDNDFSLNFTMSKFFKIY